MRLISANKKKEELKTPQSRKYKNYRNSAFLLVFSLGEGIVSLVAQVLHL